MKGYDELIDKFLLGTISEEETELLKRHEEDPEFQSALEVKQALMGAVKAHGRADLKTQMTQWEAELGATNPSSNSTEGKVISLGMWGVIAVVAAAVIIGTVFLLRSVSEPDTPSLFAAAFEPYPNVEWVTLRDEGQAQDKIGKAFSHYDREDFTTASTLLGELLLEQPDLSILFYQANAMLASDQATEPAINALKLVRSDTESAYYQPAGWFLALAYLKAGQVAPCKILLEEISKNESNKYREEAIELLKHLK